MHRKAQIQALVLVLLLVVIGILNACGSAETPTTAPDAVAEGQQLLEARCVECHNLSKTTDARKTPAEWEATVARMVNKGASLSAAEQAVLIEYLAETYAK